MDQVERFDPIGQAGKLIDVEHRARYWWAAQVVEGKDVLDAGCGTGYGMELLAAAGARSVTGIDGDFRAVEEARRRFGEADAVVHGDLRDLELPDAAFDVVVCWEVIEHLEKGSPMLGELRRVLRSDGVLLVSSPNPDVYPPGNEHHLHEYRPDELVASVVEHFSNAVGYRQHPWLASSIRSGGETVEGTTEERRSELRVTGRLEPGRETYAIVVASDAKLPDLQDLSVLGDAFEVRWWIERTGRSEAAEREARAELAIAADRAQRLEARLGETAAALLEANQSLAHIPLLESQLEELRAAHAWFEGELGRASARLRVIERSRSWRLTAPLRRVGRLARRR